MKMVRLGSVSSIITGKTPSTTDESNFGGDIPFVTPSDLDLEHDISLTPRTLSAKGANLVKVVPKSSVLVCCIGSLGKVGYAGRSVALNQQINAVVFDQSKVFPRFGFYACKRLKPIMENMAPATTVAIVSKSKFAELEIPLPTLEEQKRIAAILDQTDALRHLRSRALDRLNALGQAIFHEMFGDPLERGTTSLSEVLISSGNGMPVEQNDRSEGVPVTRIETIWNGEIDQNRVKWASPDLGRADRFFLEKGDILFSHINSPDHIGKTAIYEGRPSRLLHGINLLRLRPDRAVVSPYWLLVLLKSPPARNFFRSRCKKAVNQASLNQGNLAELTFLLPPLLEQQAFEQAFLAVLAQREVLRTAKTKGETLFTSLQHRAFQGEL